MYAVVSSGGKQYRVEAGTELVVERLTADAGSTITFDRVLLVGDGESVTVGTPTVDGATVSGTVLGEVLGPKLIVFKFKQKATYRRKRGHRQHLTRVRIDEIDAGGRRKASAKASEPAEASEEAPKKATRRRTTSTARAETAEKAKKAPKAQKADTVQKAAKADAEAAKPKTTRSRSTKASTAKKAEE